MTTGTTFECSTSSRIICNFFRRENRIAPAMHIPMSATATRMSITVLSFSLEIAASLSSFDSASSSSQHSGCVHVAPEHVPATLFFFVPSSHVNAEHSPSLRRQQSERWHTVEPTGGVHTCVGGCAIVPSGHSFSGSVEHVPAGEPATQHSSFVQASVAHGFNGDSPMYDPSSHIVDGGVGSGVGVGVGVVDIDAHVDRLRQQSVGVQVAPGHRNGASSDGMYSYGMQAGDIAEHC
jgi:hypothetical protein